ncbi:MAG: histidine--tRNA ligase [Holosporales bacterium]|jgi:histidyl-tRNA synthetase|nr:histidine--tRNA ligase [Holosporales bacterium]
MTKDENTSLAQTVRGMRDLVGVDVSVYGEIINTLMRVAYSHGYSQIETPILEFTSLFVRGLGEDTDVVGKEMFSFLDRAGQSVTLRPEGTASAVRALITNKLTQTLPQKFFYYGPMFRYDRPQKGRYRQFFQFGIEDFGESGPLSDVDVIALAHEGLSKLGVQGELFINSIGDKSSREIYKSHLVDYFSKYKNDLSEDSQRRLLTNPLRILDSKELSDIAIIEGSPSLFDFLSKDAAAFFDKVQDGLNVLSIPYSIDRTLVRGLDYYDHTTFEFKANIDSQPLAVVGGGRYNGLVEEMGGPSIPAVGLAFGVDRVMLAYDRARIPAKTVISVLFVTEKEEVVALKLANALRDKFNVIIPSDGGIAKRLKQSNTAGATCAIIIGEDEVRLSAVKCKLLKAVGEYSDGDEFSVEQANLEEFLMRVTVPKDKIL